MRDVTGDSLSRRVELTPSGAKARHGIATTYNRGCRCGQCVENNYQRQKFNGFKREVRVRAGFVDVSKMKHGKRSTYINWGCRCEPCSKAHSDACKDYLRRRKTGEVKKEFITPDVVEKARLKRAAKEYEEN